MSEETVTVRTPDTETPEKKALLEYEAPKVGLRDWLLTILFLPLFWSYFLIAEVLQRIAIPFGMRAHDWVQDFLNFSIRATLSRVLGMKLSVERFGEIPAGVPLIILSNHQAIFDVTLLHTLFSKWKPRFIAKKELGRGIPGVSFNMRRGGHALIDRTNPQQALNEIQRLGFDVADRRCAAVIFPEGTRAKRGKLKPFRHAGISMLLQTCPHAYIVPVTIDGTWKLSAFRCFPMPSNVDVNIVIGAPVRVSDFESLRDLTRELHAVIASTLDRLRSRDSSSA
ncbi:MAG: 1-acyl-sn-glycerol-3-phosphate acyltransferase [Bdellovibrionales bacterium]|nr:1-acyl-sn-glycerol-3-phosphate acyltransferase [Bdellovibrionales bacterium]